MNASSKTLILRGISLPYLLPASEAEETARKKLVKAGLSVSGAAVHKRSVDARKKDDIRFVYSVQAKVHGRITPALLDRLGAAEEIRNDALPPRGTELPDGRIVIVGFGPCGMFAAFRLAQAGYRPVVIERGDGVDARRGAIERFHRTGELDTESNVQFGAGGAGSFSDGKLITRINDPMTAAVLETYHRFGAPDSILTLAKPHVGTDHLFNCTKRMEEEIVRLGGEVHYRTKMTGFSCDARGRIRSVSTTCGEIACAALIAAVGHSARDTYEEFLRRGLSVVGKDFSVGARIEHLQEDIDRAMYGDADLSVLGHAEYTLSMRDGKRGVYSFCMCPGGEVICASSENGGLVVNGMSRYARDGKNANSAIAVSVLKEDYGGDPLSAISFQRQIERKAFEAAGGGYHAPVQTLKDFCGGTARTAPSRILPSFRAGKAVSVRDLNAVLPAFVTSLMKRGLKEFDRRISGFCCDDALLTGVETRTSAPVRIIRNDDMTAPGHDNLYPCGEGAGYAGGITSAAVDGLRAANAVIARYAPDGF